MGLIVETGAIIAGADAYVDLAYALQYHTERGNATWLAATDAAREVAIRLATQFIDGRYLSRWKGTKQQALQPRQWPRWGVRVQTVRGFSAEQYDEGFVRGFVPGNIVPEPIKQATCELALRGLTSPLAPDLRRGGRVKTKKVGPIETEYFADAPSHTVYEFVDLLLGDFLIPTNSCEIVRC